ncbi:MAG: dihydropteroate synthase [Candidatus Nitrosocaldus sp.]|nr:dihydropteroate synthase [Candidatus Nitrosocaldus sp.]MDW8000310.1 dihydropteroate synthase [Candidatus Nitrosocaldus sp.]
MVRIMGIINVSPESFYKSSVRVRDEEIACTASSMEEQGASIIDVGAMSTAPYLDTVISVEEEISRLKHAVKVIRDSCSLAISVDTPRARAADAALSSGATIVNDISGLKYDPDMARVAREHSASLIVSAYSRGTVRGDAIAATLELLRESIGIALDAGVDENKVVVDPAIGFFREHGRHEFFTRLEGMTWFERDLAVIRRLRELKVLGREVCVSPSRKSFIGRVLALDRPEDRLYGSLAVEAVCIMNGADIVRTHSVRESMHVARMVEAIIHG